MFLFIFSKPVKDSHFWEQTAKEHEHNAFLIVELCNEIGNHLHFLGVIKVSHYDFVTLFD